LNLAHPRGQTLLTRLVKDADVLVENFVPGTLEKWGLGWEVLSAENPRLVLARVSGWGQDGPYRDRPGFGTMVEAMSGFAAATGPADGPPTLPSFPMADMVAALAGAAAVLAALRHRDQIGGRGQVIDISLYEPLLSVLGPAAAEYALDGKIRARHGNQSDNASPRGTYRTRDGEWIALSASTPASARALFDGLGLGDLMKDPRFATNDARVAHNDLVDAALARAIGDRCALAPVERGGDRRLRGGDEAAQRHQSGAARRRRRPEGRRGVDRRRGPQVSRPRDRGAPRARPDRR